jgi:hypothetical protein
MPATDQTIAHWAGDSRLIRIPIKDKVGAAGISPATARLWMGNSVAATGADLMIKKSTGAGLVIAGRTTTTCFRSRSRSPRPTP